MIQNYSENYAFKRESHILRSTKNLVKRKFSPEKKFSPEFFVSKYLVDPAIFDPYKFWPKRFWV